MGWTITLLTASTPSSINRAGEEGDEAGVRLVMAEFDFKGVPVLPAWISDQSYEEIAHLPSMVIHIGRLMVPSSLAVDVNAEMPPASVLLPVCITRSRTLTVPGTKANGHLPTTGTSVVLLFDYVESYVQLVKVQGHSSSGYF
jgi:hypothetical protein